MDRRRFLAAGAMALGPCGAQAKPVTTPEFKTSNSDWQKAYDAALRVVAGNIRTLPHYDKPVLIEGASYQGIWMECGPHEALVNRKFRPDIARNSHEVFFRLQRADGQLPANNKLSMTSFGQIQMVVPMAATAWELARATKDEALLDMAYQACSRWDDWLMTYRNRRGTGLVEGFCTYDTGHDNSPRWAGIPPQCPKADAKLYPSDHNLPRLCPDLSATTYGARIALSDMARALGKSSEADQWAQKAHKIQTLILDKLYVADESAFYDLDATDAFVRVRGDILSRVCGEHVLSQSLFDELWARQIHDPKAFWSPFPLPSIALDDPAFVRPIPPNSWGGAAQALTALRAGRWMEHYGRPAEFSQMMQAWCQALITDGRFKQQMDPLTGVFTAEEEGGYTPAALTLIDYSWRLLGVREEGESLFWTIRPDHPAAQDAYFSMISDQGHKAEISYGRHKVSLTINNRPIASMSGGSGRLITTANGKPLAVQGIALSQQVIELHINGHEKRQFQLNPNQKILL